MKNLSALAILPIFILSFTGYAAVSTDHIKNVDCQEVLTKAATGMHVKMDELEGKNLTKMYKRYKGTKLAAEIRMYCSSPEPLVLKHCHNSRKGDLACVFKKSHWK